MVIVCHVSDSVDYDVWNLLSPADMLGNRKTMFGYAMFGSYGNYVVWAGGLCEDGSLIVPGHFCCMGRCAPSPKRKLRTLACDGPDNEVDLVEVHLVIQRMPHPRAILDTMNVFGRRGASHPPPR